MLDIKFASVHPNRRKYVITGNRPFRDDLNKMLNWDQRRFVMSVHLKFVNNFLACCCQFSH